MGAIMAFVLVVTLFGGIICGLLELEEKLYGKKEPSRRPSAGKRSPAFSLDFEDEDDWLYEMQQEQIRRNHQEADRLFQEEMQRETDRQMNEWVQQTNDAILQDMSWQADNSFMDPPMDCGGFGPGMF